MLSEAQREPGTVRICPMRDGPCPHGINCPFVGDKNLNLWTGKPRSALFQKVKADE